ncbi:unnamed protein product, partial [Linum tenue]
KRARLSLSLSLTFSVYRFQGHACETPCGVEDKKERAASSTDLIQLINGAPPFLSPIEITATNFNSVSKSTSLSTLINAPPLLFRHCQTRQKKIQTRGNGKKSKKKKKKQSED